MPALDASSAIHAWDNYPPEQFPSLWSWLASQIQSGDLTIAAVAMSEVGKKSPDCMVWFRAQNITVLPITQEILTDALRIKTCLGIVGDQYGTGVGENDIFIIATIRAYDAELLTDERRQPSLPASMSKYKIPAVCALPEVQVTCLSFVEYFKRSKVVFG